MAGGAGRITGKISYWLRSRLHRTPSAHGEKREITPSGERHVEPVSHSGETRTEYGKEHGAPVDAYTKLPVRKKGIHIDRNA